MAFTYTIPAETDEGGNIVVPEKSFRVQLEQVAVIGAQRQIHVVINKINMNTFAMTQEIYVAVDANYDALVAKATTGKSLFEEVGVAAWEYLITNFKEQIVYGRPAGVDEVVPEWTYVE
jgi:hypothetical protein